MLTKVRFVMMEQGPTPCFQGFHRGEYGMAGAIVWVTADTLRRIVKWHNKQMNAFDAIHNRMEMEEGFLAFGVDADSLYVTTAPDGVTPLYMLCTYEPVIVQRFDPNGGKAYDIHREGQPKGIGHFGVWENVAPYEGKVTPVGFVVDWDLWREGRSDTPPIGLADEPCPLPPYHDHDGNRTTDPRCELGLCMTCLNEMLDSGQTVVPALSVADPRFLTDQTYRDRVWAAFAVIGVLPGDDPSDGNAATVDTLAGTLPIVRLK